MLSKFLKQSSIDISCCRSSDHISCRCCFLPFRLDLVCLENNEWGHSQPPCTHALDNCAVLQFFPAHGLEGTFTGDTYNSCRLWYVTYATLVDIPYSIWGVIQPPGVQPIFVLSKNFIICAGFAPIAFAINRFTAIFFLTSGNHW